MSFNAGVPLADTVNVLSGESYGDWGLLYRRESVRESVFADVHKDYASKEDADRLAAFLSHA
jgi:hypothetical protein